MRRGQSGFSLVEISIVLAVVATMLAGILPAITESLKSRDQEVTAERMKTIQDSLLSFYVANGYLPCPANIGQGVDTALYGVEAENSNCAGGTPSANVAVGYLVGGGVPTKTLGLGDEYGFDGWGRRLSYHIDYRATTPGSFGGSGGFRVGDATGAARSDYAVYVLLSHGANGHGGYTRAGVRYASGSANADELANCDCDSNGGLKAYDGVFVQRMATQTDPTKLNTAFDDILIYKNRMAFPPINVGSGREAQVMVGSYEEDYVSGTSYANTIKIQRGGSISFPGDNVVGVGGPRQRVRFTFDAPLPDASYYVGGRNIKVVERRTDYVDLLGCYWKDGCDEPTVEFFVLY